MKILITAVAAAGMLSGAGAQVSVLMQHNNPFQTGANLSETVLNTSNANTNQFGLLFSRTVDDQIYAQPLVAAQVNLGASGTHNLVIVATVNDSVYAFDADVASNTTPYWHAILLGTNGFPPTTSDVGCSLFSGNVGIVGTPVIDPQLETLFVVARTKESGAFVQRLHALDMTSGAERPGSPVEIAATYPGNSPTDSTNGTITFNPLTQNQRSGLALLNGIVYVCWASQCDIEPYHGWIIGYDESTLTQAVVYVDTPNGSEGGIWMSGAAPSADTNGNLYVGLANGPQDNTTAPTPGFMVESYVKLTPNGTNLDMAASFTPTNWPDMDALDADLASAGMLLIPNTSLAFSGGKLGTVFLVDMGGSGGAGAPLLQTFPVTGGPLHSAPVWWAGPGGSFAYLWPSQTNLQQYQFNSDSTNFNLPAFATSAVSAPSGDDAGGFLSLSANGATAGSGILWASVPINGNAVIDAAVPGILYAFDARNVANQLWNSQQVAARDGNFNFAKYVPPTVANGKVYLATFSDQLNVYGLLSESSTTSNSPPPSAAPIGSNWVQTVQFHLAAWKNGGALSFPITGKTIIKSLSGVAVNTNGTAVSFSSDAILVRKQFIPDTNAVDIRYYVREGKPPVDTDVTAFLIESMLAGVTHAAPAHAVAGHEVDAYSLVNDPTLTFSVQGFGASTYSDLHKSTNQVLSSRTVDVSGTGFVPGESSAPVVVHGSIIISGGKLE